MKIIVFYFFISENLNEAFSHFIAEWIQGFATKWYLIKQCQRLPIVFQHPAKIRIRKKVGFTQLLHFFAENGAALIPRPYRD
jgi:hypothetical protein